MADRLQSQLWLQISNLQSMLRLYKRCNHLRFTLLHPPIMSAKMSSSNNQKRLFFLTPQYVSDSLKSKAKETSKKGGTIRCNHPGYVNEDSDSDLEFNELYDTICALCDDVVRASVYAIIETGSHSFCESLGFKSMVEYDVRITTVLY